MSIQQHHLTIFLALSARSRWGGCKASQRRLNMACSLSRLVKQSPAPVAQHLLTLLALSRGVYKRKARNADENEDSRTILITLAAKRRWYFGLSLSDQKRKLDMASFLGLNSHYSTSVAATSMAQTDLCRSDQHPSHSILSQSRHSPEAALSSHWSHLRPDAAGAAAGVDLISSS